MNSGNTLADALALELLGATVGDADPRQQLITVIRKGTRALQGPGP